MDGKHIASVIREKWVSCDPARLCWRCPTQIIHVVVVRLRDPITDGAVIQDIVAKILLGWHPERMVNTTSGPLTTSDGEDIVFYVGYVIRNFGNNRIVASGVTSRVVIKHVVIDIHIIDRNISPGGLTKDHVLPVVF